MFHWTQRMHNASLQIRHRQENAEIERIGIDKFLITNVLSRSVRARDGINVWQVVDSTACLEYFQKYEYSNHVYEGLRITS